ncbi:Uncharacterised protein (plasmid) [Mesomycoplasma neurolyticum]|uniref:Uncharacterized protein n=1 Tax=Mesomycoplasma neurolyticum TaxID=2120 RepID=A0A449A4E2_9BACT|nr:Uncharacterised protein [Mesomycoplasma neurolyticum]VEU59872.1 Uncharacterised protein [Mesomycoplasma neurolyticum]
MRKIRRKQMAERRLERIKKLQKEARKAARKNN